MNLSVDRADDTCESGKELQIACWLLLACLLAVNGCSVAQKTVALPTDMVSAVMRGSEWKQPDPAALQDALLRYADDFLGRTATGIDDYARRANRAEARDEALNWKLALGTSVVGIASGANPTANLVDFIALSSLLRTFVEQRRSEGTNGAAFEVWVDNCRVLETNAWKIADGVLSPKQQEEFRAAITQWLEQNAKEGIGFLRRPQVLAAGIRQSGEREQKPGSVFSLVGLDPTAGLDPAIREVTRTRLFAERAMFAVERMPFLLRMQTEVFTENLMRQQQLTNVLASAERLSRAAETVSQTTAVLPDRFAVERKAIVDAMEAQEGRLRDLSAEVGRTLVAGEKMSSSLNTTIRSLDALMKRFGVGEPPSGPPNTNSAPFNILDYAQTAGQIAAMAQQLDILIRDTSGTVDAPALDKRIAQLNALSSKARSDAKSVLNHAFLLAAGFLILVFLFALYRRSGRKPLLLPSDGRGELREKGL